MSRNYRAPSLSGIIGPPIDHQTALAALGHLTTVHHVHASGKWNASAPAFASYVHHLTRATPGGVVTFTETDLNYQPRILRRLHGWGNASWLNNDKAETAVIWDSSTWALESKRVERIARTRFKNDGGFLLHATNASVVRLKNRQTGGQATFITWHSPSKVEHKGMARISGTHARVAAYRESLASLRRIIAQERAKHPDVPVIVDGDWNLNVRRPWVRRYLSRALGNGVRLTWQHMGKNGTHGKRIIDASFVTGPVSVRGSAHVLSRAGIPAVFDHSPYGETLTVRSHAVPAHRAPRAGSPDPLPPRIRGYR